MITVQAIQVATGAQVQSYGSSSDRRAKSHVHDEIVSKVLRVPAEWPYNY